MVHGRREERTLLASRLAGPRGRRSGVLALAVLTGLLGATTSPAGEQGLVRGRGPVRGLLLTRPDDRRGHDPLVLGMLAAALSAVVPVVVAWRRSAPRPGRRGQPASIGARAPPILQPR
jgi:hypothetical protein